MGILTGISSGAALCINRNIVECKYGDAIFSTPLIIVLIETLWNVNCIVCRIGAFCGRVVLIETLWNVNTSLYILRCRNRMY